MKVLIDDILNRQMKTRNWLSQETGITYTNICNLCNGKTNRIGFDQLDKICSVLNCKISDILTHDYVKINRVIVQQNQLNKLTNKDDVNQM